MPYVLPKSVLKPKWLVATLLKIALQIKTKTIKIKYGKKT